YLHGTVEIAAVVGRHLSDDDCWSSGSNNNICNLHPGNLQAQGTPPQRRAEAGSVFYVVDLFSCPSESALSGNIARRTRRAPHPSTTAWAREAKVRRRSRSLISWATAACTASTVKERAIPMVSAVLRVRKACN